MSRRPAAWKRVRELLARVGRWTHKGRDDRRSAAARARFWADARAGEREAAARASS